MLSKDCKVLQSFIKKKSEKFANIAKCCRVFYKKSEKFANVAEPTNVCSAFDCCKYCRVLKIVQMLQMFSKNK